MAKRAVKVVDKHIDRDVELCRTTNVRVGNQTMQLLIEERIPFTQNWIRVPFYKREKYKGAREICVIHTHCNQYSRARRALDQMEVFCRERLIVHAV